MDVSVAIVIMYIFMLAGGITTHGSARELCVERDVVRTHL